MRSCAALRLTIRASVPSASGKVWCPTVTSWITLSRCILAAAMDMQIYSGCAFITIVRKLFKSKKLGKMERGYSELFLVILL